MTHKTISQLITEAKEQAKEIVGALEVDKHYFMAYDVNGTVERKVLKKPGAEIIASALGLVGEMKEVQVELSDASNPKSAQAIVRCVLVNKQGNVEACGVGAYAINPNGMNTAMKMAAKSAFIDATIRATGISDCFTQDLQEIPTPSIVVKAPVAVDISDEKGSNSVDEKQELINWIEDNIPFSSDIPFLFGAQSLKDLSVSILKKVIADQSKNATDPIPQSPQSGIIPNKQSENFAKPLFTMC
jgi:hypothetical protein